MITQQRSIAQTLCRVLPPMASQRLFMTLAARERRRPPQRFVAPTITGSRFSHVTGDILADTVLACGFWDWRNLAIAAALCAPGESILEVGANTGTETLGYADIVGPSGHVHAFEPEPAIRQALEHNLLLNQRANVSVHGVAVADRCGTARFARAASEANSGTGHLAAQSADSPEDLIVPMVTLDSLAEQIGFARLLCVDVEGWEVAVLRGAQAYLRKHRPALIVEACSMLLERAGSSLDELAGELERFGYAIFEIGKVRLRSFAARHATRTDYERNWLCLPAERDSARGHVDAMLLRCALAPRFGRLNPLAPRALRRIAR